jgi:hypothetical protein
MDAAHMDVCGEYPAFGDGSDVGTGTRFVLDYSLPSLVDLDAADRMESLCAFESAS